MLGLESYSPAFIMLENGVYTNEQCFNFFVIRRHFKLRKLHELLAQCLYCFLFNVDMI